MTRIIYLKKLILDTSYSIPFLITKRNYTKEISNGVKQVKIDVIQSDEGFKTISSVMNIGTCIPVTDVIQQNHKILIDKETKKIYDVEHADDINFE
jgi:predicted nucleic acid-binding protein